MALETGSILHDRYRIDGTLGKGGMGAVFLAFDQTLQIKVALKENLNLNPESERQFHREASLLASLRHPNLPRVTDHFILEGRQYLVMDYIEGEDLHARVRRQPPTPRDVLRWADAVCDALVYLHSRKPPVIHRDIKPSNIKVQPDGNVVLVDFGLAKVFDHQQTSTGARGLTPGFSPPEQYGSGRTDARSDQYALAATMYNLLTGTAPTDSIERMMGNEELKPATAYNPAVPPHVEACLERALSISQDQRFPDVAAFQAALKGQGPSPTLRADLPTLQKKSSGRPAWLWFGLAGAALIGIVLVGGGVALALAGGLPG
ncbi:MAG: serine/threonine-protein kinase, partial [Anaerolineales bacterium]